MKSSPAPTKIRRQNRLPKWRTSIRWDNANYDYLDKLAEKESCSIAAIANKIIREHRQRTALAAHA